MQYPPEDQSAARAEAAAAMLAAIRDVRDANERLQSAAAWVLEAFGDTADAETIRMLPVAGPARPGRPAVPPPATSRHLTDELTGDEYDVTPVRMQGGLYVPAHIADVVDPDGDLREDPESVTVTEGIAREDCGCTWAQIDGLVPTDCTIHGAHQ